MPLPLAAPLAPVAAGALLSVGGFLKTRQGAAMLPGQLPFRGGGRALPPVTGREGTATLAEMIRDAVAGARLPVGFVPPEPQGPSPEDLIAAAAAAAAGLWGAWEALSGAANDAREQAGNLWNWLNRPALPGVVGPYPGGKGGELVTVTTSTTATGYVIQETGKTLYNYSLAPWSRTYNLGYSRETVNGQYYRPQFDVIINTDAVDTSLGPANCNYSLEIYLIKANGDRVGVWAMSPRRFGVGEFDVTITPNEAPNATWATTSNLSDPPNRGTALPGPVAAPAPVWPALILNPFPLLPPAPDAEVGTMPEVTPTTTDAETLTAIPVVTPSYGPSLGTQVVSSLANPLAFGVDAIPLPQLQARPRTTPVDVHVINGKEVSGAGARVDLADMAKELKRVETKLGTLMAPGLGSGAVDWLDDLFDLLFRVREVIDMLNADVEETTWEVTAPCNKDANDEPLKLTYEFPAGEYLPASLARIEAMMDMLGQTLSWRRPVCKGAVTNNVTITAYGIDPS